jgi:carboxyl-terminal processing protease
MLTPDTGYLWVTDFSRGTGAEVGEALRKLKAAGMERLLLDLRNNGGGLLDQAIDVADYFLADGSLIVETRGRTRDSFAEYQDSGSHAPIDLPVVVLVNQGTASAAEIVSGAVQDHDVGLIVGTPTWGKGLVQTVYNLPYGAGLALTTARYYTPAGRLIQRDYSSFYDYYTYYPELGSDEGEAVPESGERPSDEPAYYTDLGRKVYGGGGITPDVVVAPEELSPYSQFLISRNAHFDFAVDYVRRHQVKAAELSPEWRPDGTVLDEFRAWIAAEGMSPPEEVTEGLAADAAGADALMRIRSEVFNALWGQDASHRVRAEGDAQIQRGLELFDRARDLRARRNGLDEADGDQVAGTAGEAGPGS